MEIVELVDDRQGEALQMTEIGEVSSQSEGAWRVRLFALCLLDLDPELPMTTADFHQMQQVFVNLITNAEQAMIEAHGKGKLTIKTQQLDHTVRVTIADSGPGIPQENLKRVFDPFFTTKEVGEGTGLGLSICYGIVQEHHGNISVNSIPGQGTSFLVEIPITSEDQHVKPQNRIV